MPDVELSWSLHTRADLASTWALLSDTDRFNRVAGVGLHFEVRTSDRGAIERLGWSRRLGMRIDWEELPFEYEAPEWFESVRRFPAGPAKELRARLELRPDADGTGIRYSVRLTPRNAVTWAVIAADARLSVRPQLDRALRRAVEVLDDPARIYDPPPPPLSGDARARLDAALSRVVPVALRDDLAERIASAPLFRQQRIAPLAVAARLGLDPDAVIAGFLDAVRAGALTLEWELLCPRCQGPKAVLGALRVDPGAVHCPTCDIRFDGSFPDAVVARFGPAPAIREIDVPIECLLSPARTPHILANRAVEAGGTAVIELALEPGGYVLRTEPPTATASLEVRPGLRQVEASADLTRDGLAPALLRVAPGTVRLHLRSRLDAIAYVSVERRWRPPWALTAGRLLEIPGATELLPPDALAAGVVPRALAQAVVHVDLLAPDPEAVARVEAVLAARSPRLLHRADGRFVATFDAAGSAIAAAEALDGDRRLATGLAFGPVIALGEDDDDAVPHGSAVAAAVAASRSGGAGRTAIDGDPAPWITALGEDRLRVAPDGLVWFASTAERSHKRLFGEPGPPPGAVGSWSLGERLGAGGFGAVYRASGPGAVDAVVKLLHDDRADDPEQAQRFYNEARIASSLRHPNTVRVHDWGHAPDGRPYLVMERLIGRELAEALDGDGTIAPRKAVRVAIQALGALDEAHRAGVVHRDVKPSNLFLCTGGVAKLIDFGIAAELDGEAPDDRGVLLGTPEYLSPEQADRLPLDGRSDVYAVGLVLYRCLAGKLPFDGPNAIAVALKRTVVDPEPIDRIAPEVPPRLAEVVMRALAREPGDRWESAEAMRVALAELYAELPA